jgi:hypothetical protein
MSADLRRVAAWVFKRLGRRSALHPGALAIALGLHFVPVNSPGARIIGTRLEYEVSAPVSRKRWLVMRECAREILRMRGVTPDDTSAEVLAMLFSVPDAVTYGASQASVRAASVAFGRRGSVVKAGTFRRYSTQPRVPKVL